MCKGPKRLNPQDFSTHKLVLASTSRYRAAALRNLGLVFTAVAADIDETPVAQESPQDTATRLALAKCSAVQRLQPHSVVIGSDQVGYCDGRRLSKPGSFDAALAQLQHCRGKTAVFHSAVAVWNPHSHEYLQAVTDTRLGYKMRSDAELAAYLHLDQPYDCAGSFKIERRGITLFDSVTSTDPSALVGLPLIATLRLLAQAGINVLRD